MPLNAMQDRLCAENATDFSDLSAIILNCTLKREPERSHTGLLLSVPEEIMRRNGVAVATNLNGSPSNRRMNSRKVFDPPKPRSTSASSRLAALNSDRSILPSRTLS